MTLASDIVVSTFERVGDKDGVADCLNAKWAIVGRNAGVFKATGTVEFGERPVQRIDGAPGEISRVEGVSMYRQPFVNGIALGVHDDGVCRIGQLGVPPEDGTTFGGPHECR